MKRALTIVSTLTLALTAALVVAGTIVARQGGLIVGEMERFPGAALVVQVISAGTLAALILTLVAVILALIDAARKRQWIWFVAFLVLVPIGLFGWLALAFEGGLGPGALPLLLPLATLVYALRGRPRARLGDAA
jgi:hypothetical protein